MTGCGACRGPGHCVCVPTPCSWPIGRLRWLLLSVGARVRGARPQCFVSWCFGGHPVCQCAMPLPGLGCLRLCFSKSLAAASSTSQPLANGNSAVKSLVLRPAQDPSLPELFKSAQLYSSRDSVAPLPAVPPPAKHVPQAELTQRLLAAQECFSPHLGEVRRPGMGRQAGHRLPPTEALVPQSSGEMQFCEDKVTPQGRERLQEDEVPRTVPRHAINALVCPAVAPNQVGSGVGGLSGSLC